jgi:hypothetical protein
MIGVFSIFAHRRRTVLPVLPLPVSPTAGKRRPFGARAPPIAEVLALRAPRFPPNQSKATDQSHRRRSQAFQRHR